MQRDALLHVAIGVGIALVDRLLAFRPTFLQPALRVAVALTLGSFLRPPLGVELARVSWGDTRTSVAWSVRFLGRVALAGSALFTVAVLGRLVGTPPFHVPRILVLPEAWAPTLANSLLIAPIVEEVVHRGVVYPRLAAALGTRGAVFAAGMLFWALHWPQAGPVATLETLAGGWILAFARASTGSLAAPVLLHFLGNLALCCCDLVWWLGPVGLRELLGGK